jgi:hypothetical protein
MANTDAPKGLTPIQTPFGGLQVHEYDKTASTALFLGDPVTKVAAGTVQRAAAGNSLVGVCVGIKDADGVPVNYVAASDATACKVLVADDPDQLFMCQEDSGGGALAEADRGLNCDLVIADGDTGTGVSKVEIDSSTKATTAATVRLIDIVKRADNAIGDNADWVVKIVEHQNLVTTGV